MKIKTKQNMKSQRIYAIQGFFHTLSCRTSECPENQCCPHTPNTYLEGAVELAATTAGLDGYDGAENLQLLMVFIDHVQNWFVADTGTFFGKVHGHLGEKISFFVTHQRQNEILLTCTNLFLHTISAPS
jgi:hypothetical protein